MNILLFPVGSAGDVHPFIGLGLALKTRGHQVTVVTNGHFGPLARRVGLDFVEQFSDAQYRETLDNPDLWHPVKGFKIVMQATLLLMRPTYDLIKDRYIAGETVVVAGCLSFGARIAQEMLGIPLATVHLQPAVFRSVHQGPTFARMSLAGRMPHFLKRAIYWSMDSLMIDRLLAPGINAFRAELGLAPVRRLFDGWWNSPQCVLALFPDWYAAPQPDWPPQTRLTGFPLYDESGAAEVPAALASFLARGEPPIVFTPGSAMRQGNSFFEASVDACRRLGRRGVLLTQFRDQVPAYLPDSISHFAYVPFSQVLPKSAALVHHGGIGTTAQALAAGIPHLVMPMAHDQPDNAARLVRLGVARSIRPRAYKAPEVAKSLAELLGSPAIAERCCKIARRFDDVDPLGEACRIIEQLAEHRLNLASNLSGPLPPVR